MNSIYVQFINEQFFLIKAAQGFSVRCTSVRHNRKSAENAEQDKKGPLRKDTI